jgi:hypothetical protein
VRAIYGSFQHSVGEITDCQVRYALGLSRRNTAFTEKKIISARGTIVASGQAAVEARAAQIRDAYALNGFDWSLVMDSGADTSVALYNAASFTGVRVTRRPTFDVIGSRAGYVTNLNFSVELEAEYLRGSEQDRWLDFRERITVSGNGLGIRVIKPVDFGDWVEQQVTTTSPVIVMQEGQGIAKVQQPFPNAAIYPERILDPTKDVSTEEFSPERNGNAWFGFGVRWSYRMTFLSGVPVPHPTYK